MYYNTIIFNRILGYNSVVYSEKDKLWLFDTVSIKAIASLISFNNSHFQYLQSCNINDLQRNHVICSSPATSVDSQFKDVFKIISCVLSYSYNETHCKGKNFTSKSNTC